LLCSTWMKQTLCVLMYKRKRRGEREREREREKENGVRSRLAQLRVNYLPSYPSRCKRATPPSGENIHAGIWYAKFSRNVNTRENLRTRTALSMPACTRTRARGSCNSTAMPHLRRISLFHSSESCSCSLKFTTVTCDGHLISGQPHKKGPRGERTRGERGKDRGEKDARSCERS